MRLRGLPRERVMACILRILSTCFMRPGSQVYAKENGSFGIATLQRRHASVHGDTVHFEYRGKAGKMQVRELRDRRVARIVRELKKLRERSICSSGWRTTGASSTSAAARQRVHQGSDGPEFLGQGLPHLAGTLVAACCWRACTRRRSTDARTGAS